MPHTQYKHKTIYILGINAYHPDSSACLIKDGQLIAAVEEERFNRIKHWAGFPMRSIRYCLEEAGIGMEGVDYVALNRNPRANIGKKILFLLSYKPPLSLIRDRFSNICEIKNIPGILSRDFSMGRKLKAKIYNIEHHRAHLASAFFVSPFQKSAVVSLDGFGDFTSCMVAKGEGRTLRCLYEVNYPHSLGLFYTALTQFLGFHRFGDEYKVMGLAAYGKPRYLKEMQKIIILKPRGRFILDLDYFSFYRNKNCMLWNNTEPTLGDIFSRKIFKKLGPARKYEDKITDYHYDLAASLQKAYEEAFFHILNYVYRITKETNLCLAGGCALNSVANGKILSRTPFKGLYIQPGASDAGGALGAGYYLYHHIFNYDRIFTMKNAYWGPAFSPQKVQRVLDSKKEELKQGSCVTEEIADKDRLCYLTANYIAEGKIVGWFQGRMEWGARALGNRSILADPRRKEMRDILNERIKKREYFRPFAPSILLERIGEYFEESYPDPFMLTVYHVRKDKRDIIPAVVHVDGTGRIQTVSRDENPLFWKLIKEFERITGIPLLLNTSFNENEPIICGPQEAIDCFLRTKMDMLILGNYLIRK